jgi:hypothetical protein
MIENGHLFLFFAETCLLLLALGIHERREWIRDDKRERRQEAAADQRCKDESAHNEALVREVRDLLHTARGAIRQGIDLDRDIREIHAVLNNHADVLTASDEERPAVMRPSRR